MLIERIDGQETPTLSPRGHTVEKCQQEVVCSIYCRVELGVVERIQRAKGVHHPEGVVDEQGVVVLPQVESTLSPHPVALSHP